LTDRANEAFRRLLVDAKAGGQAKVDALVAISQRVLSVATWGPDDSAGYRTLTNANGETALPVFTNASELERAADQFGWRDGAGAVSSREVGARAAFNYAVAQNLHYVVIDIASSHSLDVDRDELASLVSAAARRESTGPFAAVGRVSSTIMAAVKPTPQAGSPRGPMDHTKEARAAAARGATLTASSIDDAAAITTFGSGTSVAVHKLKDPPTDALLDAVSDVLRSYPEVEWAAITAIARGPAAPVPTIGLKVDTAFRQRVNEIVQRVRVAGEGVGATLDVLLLDDPGVMRTVRTEAKIFYPWRR
jgi:hypothetical protein